MSEERLKHDKNKSFSLRRNILQGRTERGGWGGGGAAAPPPLEIWQSDYDALISVISTPSPPPPRNKRNYISTAHLLRNSRYGAALGKQRKFILLVICFTKEAHGIRDLSLQSVFRWT